jgi:hypothetical protein
VKTEKKRKDKTEQYKIENEFMPVNSQNNPSAATFKVAQASLPEPYKDQAQCLIFDKGVF